MSSTPDPPCTLLVIDTRRLSLRAQAASALLQVGSQRHGKPFIVLTTNRRAAS